MQRHKSSCLERVSLCESKRSQRRGKFESIFLLFFFPFLHHCSALRVDGIICSRVLPVKPLECQLDFRSQQTVSEVLGVRPGSIPSRPLPYAGIINLSEIRWPILHDSARAACSKTNIWGWRNLSLFRVKSQPKCTICQERKRERGAI